ncbi:MAG: paraquat-inducible protein A [Gammaproteobacteria bacterium]|nr:paraquat-inducible protein A [Gammaproteobacteria bacterium]
MLDYGRKADVTERLIICAHCGAAHRRVPVLASEAAYCRRCGAALALTAKPDVERLLALTLTAALLFAITSTTPILSIEFGGVRKSASIWLSALSLEHGWITGAAMVLGLTSACIPLMQILILLWMLGFAGAGRRAPGARHGLLVLHALRPWSMTEVFLLAVLVVIVKLSSWVHVSADAGAWALAALAVTLTLLNMQAPATWWQILDERAA